MPVPDYLVSIYRTEKSLLTGDAASGQKDCTVVDGSIFAEGDIVRIKDDNKIEGNKIAVGGIAGNVLTMENDLLYTYEVAENGQVIRCDALTVDPDEVISLTATQTVAGEVAEAVIVFDNEPKKEYIGGDLIEISLGYGEQILAKVFSGEILEANQKSKDEHKRLVLRARNWSLLFLTDKVTSSYPTATSARQIVLDLLEEYILSHVKGQWHLNDGSGITATDSSICGTHNGTLVNGPVWTAPGHLGSHCLYFDGSNDHVDLGDFCDFQRTEKFSVEFWFKTSEVGQTNHIVAKMMNVDPWTGWAVRTVDGRIDVALYNDFGAGNAIKKQTTAAFNNNAWHHCVVTYDGSCSASGVIIYVDGTLQAATVILDGLTGSIQTAVHLRFGTRDNNGWGYIGFLDEVVIYSTVLFQTQVDIRFNGGTGTEIPLYPSSITACDRKITVCNVESTGQTRTIDFVGEPLFDCLIKISSVTVHDFYVDENKDFNWFSRLSRVSGKTLTNEDLEDYDVTSPYELLCNKAKVYGRDNKTVPWDCDIWTEDPGGVDVFDIDKDGETDWVPLFGSTIAWQSAVRPKKGTYSLRINVAPAIIDWYEYNPNVCVQHTTVLFGPGHANLDIIIPCLSGKSIRFHRACGTHAGAGNVQISYRFGSTGNFINVGTTYPPPTPACRCPNDPVDEDLCTDANSFVGGGINEDLTVRYHLAVPLFFTGTACATLIEYCFVPTATQEQFGAKFSLPLTDWSVYKGFLNGLDLSTKQGQRTLKFVIGTRIDTPQYGENPSFNIKLYFKDGHTASYAAQFFGVSAGEWSTIEIPVGPQAKEEGWTDVPSGKVYAIEFDLTLITGAYDGTDYVLIDWLHFDNGKWFGESEDSGSGSSQEEYGMKFKEVFDDTCYSDAAADRIAVEFVNKFKDPIKTVKDVVADFDGQQTLNPGEKITINLAHEGINLDYRIESIMHDLTEELDYFTNLVLSLDPILFPGQVFQVSERVRRLEQKYKRTPAAEVTEVS